MNRWDVVLLVVAGYVAVTALVRLMIRRRDQLLDELRRQFRKDKIRKGADRQEKNRPSKRNKAA